MKKTIKIISITLSVLFVLLLVIGVGAWSMFGEIITAANSVKKLKTGLYSMEFKGDYGLDQLMEQGGASDADELAIYLTQFLSQGFYTPETSESAPAYGCSTLSATTSNGNAVFGRNYDWESCNAMIIHTVPENGYESISTACPDFLGFGEEWLPEGMENQIMALAAIYVPLDGINEKGLFVADLMAGDDTVTKQDTDKPNVTTTLALRLMLDHAATVDEAISLLQQYDMNSDIGSAHHYAIADASGRSVVVEYLNEDMVVTSTPIVTNHYLSAGEKQGVGSAQSHDRYDKLLNTLERANGVLETDGVKNALQSVSQGSYKDEYELTVWSIVYQCRENSISAQFYWNENYEEYYELSLQTEEWISFVPVG